MKKTVLIIFSFVFVLLFSGCLDDLFDSVEDVKDEISQMTGTMSNYGNWCGPGHSGPEAPLDSMDTCCQSHDLCYEALNLAFDDYAQCQSGDKLDCDTALVDCLQDLDSDSENWPVPPADTAAADEYRADAIGLFSSCELISDKL